MPKFKNTNQKLDWILQNPRIKRAVSHHLNTGGHIPQMVFGYSPVAAEEAANFINAKMLPSDINAILHQEKGLLSREVSFIRQRLDRVGKINFFDVAETSGDSSLPFIYELLEHDMMGKYIPVTPNHKVNQAASDRILAFITQALLPEIKFDEILVDSELHDFKAQVVDISKESDEDSSLNLFVLSGSRLGNSHQPERMLKNIYDSMNEGDCLAVIQGLYRAGTEDTIVQDYQSVVAHEGSLMVQKVIADELNPEGKHQIYWQDGEIPGIRFGTKAKENVATFDAEVEQNKIVDLFISNRFREAGLRDMLLKIGYHFIDIAYDRHMDHGLFFLEK